MALNCEYCERVCQTLARAYELLSRPEVVGLGRTNEERYLLMEIEELIQEGPAREHCGPVKSGTRAIHGINDVDAGSSGWYSL